MTSWLSRRGKASGVVLIALLMLAPGVVAQTAKKKAPARPATVAYKYAYQHGYRAGVEDGFTKGKSDFNENKSREYAGSDAYQRADRTYKETMGTLAEYQEGYRVGFELGYNDGYFGRPLSTTLPGNLGKAVVSSINANTAAVPVETPARPRVADEQRQVETPRPAETRDRVSGQRSTITIRDGVQMKLRLTSAIDTRTNKEGDRFTAVVLDPTEYADATIEGHIAKLNKSGKATGKTELTLAFDTIRLQDGRSGRMAAQVERVYESETVKTVDEEGNVQTGSRTKETATRGVGGAALGAIIGGIAGGGKGAAIGAAIGAGAGIGSVYIQGGKEMVLDPGTEILIRTASPARTRD